MQIKNGLFLVVLFLINCTHLNTKITRLPYNSSKFDTMDKLGSPFQIKRRHGLDYWIYKFKVGEKEYTRKIVFKDGRMIRKGNPARYPKPQLILDGVKNLKEYGEAVEQFQKQKKK